MKHTLGGYPAEEADMSAVVSRRRYNPSSWRQRIPICILGLIACLIASYMAMYQWRLVDDVWDPVFGDQSKRVLDSDVAKDMYRLLGIHDASLGALAYLGDAVFGLAGSTRRWQYRPWMVLLFGIDVILLSLVGALLVVAQAAVVGHWCFLCLVTATISLGLVWLAYDEVYTTLKYLHRVRKTTGKWEMLWQALIGRPSQASTEVAAAMIAEASVEVAQRQNRAHRAA